SCGSSGRHPGWSSPSEAPTSGPHESRPDGGRCRPHKNVTAVEVRRHIEAAHQGLRVTDVFLSLTTVRKRITVERAALARLAAGDARKFTSKLPGPRTPRCNIRRSSGRRGS